jgi:negative regulator of flagellin synthesis FlgM
MRITPQGLTDTSGIGTGTAPVQDTTRVQDTANVSSAAASSGHTGGSGPALQSAVLAPAMDALSAMSEIDHAKVAAIRDALAKGEIRFDAGKLAGLITRYHDSHGQQGGQS